MMFGTALSADATTDGAAAAVREEVLEEDGIGASEVAEKLRGGRQ